MVQDTVLGTFFFHYFLASLCCSQNYGAIHGDALCYSLTRLHLGELFEFLFCFWIQLVVHGVVAKVFSAEAVCL